VSGAPPAAPAPTRWVSASIERVVHQTPRAVSVFVRAPLPAHVAGQHVDVRLTADDGYQAQRSYSIASAPGATALELVIERLPDGEVSPYFHEAAQPGDTFELRGPLGGHFVWRAADGGPLLLVGGGSGVVPLMSIAREHAARASTAPALLVYSARTWDDIIFRDELLAARAAGRTMAVVLATTREDPRPGVDLGGRLDAAALTALLARWAHAPQRVYVCGSNAFVEAIATALVEAGLAPARIRTERYGGSAAG